MKILGNILWFIFGGFFLFLLWIISGIICCITIIGIPFGVQCFKLAALSLFPFGKVITYPKVGVGSLIGNILWLIFLGWELAMAHLFVGLLCCITIVGIPFGIQCFKLAQVCLFPFGVTFEKA
jgi:uncharacterized membrane protein YccF (DUF307 family)